MYEQELDAMEQWDMDGTCQGTCNKCGHEQTVEPDGDYPCPECKGGRLQSPLIRAGMI